MVFVSDLMRGLIALQEAPEEQLREPERGYCIPGLSFSAEQLFVEIKRHNPDFKATIKLDENMNTFAQLWPNTLSKKEPLEDLGYEPRIGLREMVAHCMIAHEERLARSRVVFRLVDDDGDGLLMREDMRKFLTEMLYMPDTIDAATRKQYINELVERAYQEIDCPDGKISYPEFHNWMKRNTISNLVTTFSEEKELGSSSLSTEI